MLINKEINKYVLCSYIMNYDEVVMMNLRFQNIS